MKKIKIHELADDNNKQWVVQCDNCKMSEHFFIGKNLKGKWPNYKVEHICGKDFKVIEASFPK